MQETKANNGIRRFAALTAAVTLALILAGGFVTTTRTGDTIPTWPRTWGQMYAPGWLVEASHRYVAYALPVRVLPRDGPAYSVGVAERSYTQSGA